MTAIAGFKFNGYTCVIGDLLISSPNPISNADIPMIGKQTKPFKIKGANYYINRLYQKLITINNNLIVCWAGSAYNAYIIIEQLKQYCSTKNPQSVIDYHFLIEKFRKICERYNDISIIFAIELDSHQIINDYNCDNNLLGENYITVAGSGDTYVYDTFIRSSLENVDKYDNYQNAITKLISSAATMWFWDLTGKSLTSAFGGGYEIALGYNGEMVKLTDILYMNFIYKPETGLQVFGIIKKIDYYKEILIIRIITSELDMKSDNSLPKAVRKDLYLVPPLGDSITPELNEEILDSFPNFKPRYYGVHLIIHYKNIDIPKTSLTYTYSNPENDNEDMLEYKFSEDKIFPDEINISSVFWNKLKNKVIEQLASVGEEYHS